MFSSPNEVNGQSTPGFSIARVLGDYLAYANCGVLVATDYETVIVSVWRLSNRSDGEDVSGALCPLTGYTTRGKKRGVRSSYWKNANAYMDSKSSSVPR